MCIRFCAQPFARTLDAAICADIMLDGPSKCQGVREHRAHQRGCVIDPEEGLGYVLAAIKMIRKELDGKTPLNRFCRRALHARQLPDRRRQEHQLRAQPSA